MQSRIGAGGMGEVYLAYDRKLDRPVALKLLSSSLAADRERLRRFHQEARAASSLNHPHILVIHDFGDHEGRPFMVTEFIEGRTLRQMLQAGAIPVAQAVGIAIQAASALAAAHARGIVHRDIKPENVMVRPDGYVKVLDFGLAKLAVPAQAEADGLAVRTQPGMLMGTPRYMSPEQARGLELDARTDVWSLGVVLYEMLSGRAPFAGATSADLIAAVLGSEPTPLELQAPAVPAALGRIVGRALIKHRPDRYETVAQMRAELDVVLKGLDLAEPAPPITGAGPPWPLSAESTPVAGRRTPTRLIVLPFRILRADPETDFLAFSLADAISTALSSLDSLVVRSTMSATRFTSDTLDPQAIADQMQVDAVVAGTLLRAGMQLRASAQLLSIPQGTILWSDRMDVSMADIFRLQDELTERIVDALAVPLTAREQETLRRDVPASAEAYELYLRGNTHFYHFDDWTIARDLYLECVKRDAGFAPAWARLGRCFRLSAKFKSASVVEMTDNLRRADVAFRKAFELNPDLPLAHHLFTALETDLGRAEDAMMRLVRRAQQRRNDPEIYAGLVHACRYCGLLEASVAAHERARALDPLIPTSVVQTHWMLGDFDKAIPAFASGTNGFFPGLAQLSLGRPAEALAIARAAVASDPLVRSYQSILPFVIEGRTDECLALLDALAPRNPDPESVFYIARTYAHLGATDRALAQFDRAVNMGFFCWPTFTRDVWLDSIRDEPAFAATMARAQARHDEALGKFRDAGGERLLGLSANASSSAAHRPQG